MAQSNHKTLEEIIRELPLQAKHKLEDYALLLWERSRSQKKAGAKKISTEGWRGALKDFRDQYTSNVSLVLSEKTLAKDWLRPEEDEAWAYLQEVQS